MASEMAEQPRVLSALAARRAELAAEVRAAVGAEAPAGIVLVARGSSDNAAVFGRYVLELATRRPVALAAPSLVTRYGVDDRLDGWLAVGVSQSGKTPEIVTVLERYGAAGRADRRHHQRPRQPAGGHGATPPSTPPPAPSAPCPRPRP